MIKSRNIIRKRLTIIYVSLILGFISPLSLTAQNNDKAFIEHTINNYIVGWRTGNIELLKKAFDLQTGIVLWVDKKGESDLLKSMMFSGIIPKAKPHSAYGIYRLYNSKFRNYRFSNRNCSCKNSK